MIEYYAYSAHTVCGITVETLQNIYENRKTGEKY
jgi:hypothetical protein